MHYRGAGTEPYTNAALAFRESPRPIFVPRTGEPFAAPSLSSWEVLYPIARWTRRAYSAATPSPKENLSPVLVPGRAGRMYHDILVETAIARSTKGEAIDWPGRIATLRKFSTNGGVPLYGEVAAPAAGEPATIEGWRRIAHERDVAIKERDEARARYRMYRKQKDERRAERDRATTERDDALQDLELMKQNKSTSQLAYVASRRRVIRIIRRIKGRLKNV